MKSEEVRVNKMKEFYTSNVIEFRVLDYLEKFTKAMFDSLEAGEEKYGNFWLNQTDEPLEEFIQTKLFNKLRLTEVEKMNWASIAGYAMIAWIHANYPEIFNDSG